MSGFVPLNEGFRARRKDRSRISIAHSVVEPEEHASSVMHELRPIPTKGAGRGGKAAAGNRRNQANCETKRFFTTRTII